MRATALRSCLSCPLVLAACGDGPDESAAADTGGSSDDGPAPPTTSTSAPGETTATTLDDDEGDSTTETSDGTSTSESSSSTGTFERTCPDHGPPPGPAVRKFDVVTLSCAMDQLECPSEDDQCFCQPHFDALDVAPPHFLATSTDNNKAAVWAAGNFQAAYVDDLNTDWEDGGQARADAMIASIDAGFECGAPEWYIVNEISASQWPDNATYRQFVIDFAIAMDVDYGKSVVIAAPFSGPANHPADWAALADHAYVGAEVYLSGADVNASGNSVAWCLEQYQGAVDAYGALGVPLSRLFLFEHFGQTTPDKNWGRSGVSVAGWHNAIEARAAAADMIDFAGFVSYAWSWNLMHETDENRLAFMETYVALPLP
jgi:hypothetical protein